MEEFKVIGRFQEKKVKRDPVCTYVFTTDVIKEVFQKPKIRFIQFPVAFEVI
jgi:hypothetical protein